MKLVITFLFALSAVLYKYAFILIKSFDLDLASPFVLRNEIPGVPGVDYPIFDAAVAQNRDLILPCPDGVSGCKQ